MFDILTQSMALIEYEHEDEPNDLLHERIIGTPEFEVSFQNLMNKNGFERPVVWRGFMGGEARFRFIDSFRAEANPFQVLQADYYESTESNSGHFFYVYQKAAGFDDTALTYILSPSLEPVRQKSIQIARYGTYQPRVYRVSPDKTLPVMEGYRGGCPPVSTNELTEIIPQMHRLFDGSSTTYVTNRLATYLYDHTELLGTIDGQDLKAKIFLHLDDQQKYVAEVMPEDETGGIDSFGGNRFEETNDSWYGGSHHLHGPHTPPVDIPRQFDPSLYSGLKLVSAGEGKMWLAGVVKGHSGDSMLSLDTDTGAMTEACDLLIQFKEDENPNTVLAAIVRAGLGSLVKDEYLSVL